MSIGIHIFRRDLRLNDNVALHLLSKEVDKIIPIFIFDPFQIDKTSENEHYRSNPAIKIMIESLEDLDTNTNINYFYGTPYKVLQKLIKDLEPKCISYNADFSEYSLERDKLMDEVCEKYNVKLIKYMDDNCLNTMELYLNGTAHYKVFGAFYKHGIKQKIRDEVNKPNNFLVKKITNSYSLKKDLHKLYELPKDHENLVIGGRKEALKILNNLSQFKNYESDRDMLLYNTTFLSTYLKFGCISIVETYNHMKKHNLTALIRQLFWRQFHFILSRFNYNKYKFSDDFFSKIAWKNNVSEAKALWSGNTGFPIIDCGVRQLLQTGYMHNRLRLYVSNFAIKVLHQNPYGKIWGGQVQFSKMLIDCCYANNYGNWNNTLGPYDIPGYRYGKAGTKSGRLYDPTNFKKWDPKLKFIRNYIPELKDVSDRDVFNWHKTHVKYPEIKYSKPIVNFGERKEEWFNLTKK
jgi:deoxyribodipyrimidine photo-lyase